VPVFVRTMIISRLTIYRGEEEGEEQVFSSIGESVLWLGPFSNNGQTKEGGGGETAWNLLEKAYIFRVFVGPRKKRGEKGGKKISKPNNQNPNQKTTPRRREKGVSRSANRPSLRPHSV